jgi:hypothetical protein
MDIRLPNMSASSVISWNSVTSNRVVPVIVYYHTYTTLGTVIRQLPYEMEE